MLKRRMQLSPPPHVSLVIGRWSRQLGFEAVDWIRVGTVGGSYSLCGGVAITPGSSTKAAALWIARSGSSRVRVYSRGIQVPPPDLALARVAQQSSCSGLRTPLEW